MFYTYIQIINFYKEAGTFIQTNKLNKNPYVYKT